MGEEKIIYVQLPMFDASSDWLPPNPANLPSWADAKRVAIDIETYDPDIKTLGCGVRRDGFICGVSFAIEDGPSYYLPFAHESGDNMDAEIVKKYLRDQARDFTGTLVLMSGTYDLDYLAELGIVFRRVEWFRDVGISGVLINELHPKNSLDDLLLRAGLSPKEEGGLVNAAKAWGLRAKGDLWKLPARHVGPYAIGDVELPLQLLRRHEREIEKQGLEKVWDLESRVLPITIKMRRRGVRVDFDRLEQIATWALGQEQGLLDRVKAMSGVEIPTEHLLKKDLTASALAAVGIELPLTPNGQPATNKDALEEVNHDVARWILKAKKFHKLRTSDYNSMHRFAVLGRIHATFRQVKGTVEGKEDEEGAAYGRFSSVKPNMTQQKNPKKDKEIGGMWRQIFLPDEGAMWASCDYSAQEPRMAVHYAALTNCTGAWDMVQKYRDNPEFDIHDQTSLLCRLHFKRLRIPPEEHRDVAKIILLASFYGMGGAKLCDSLGLDTELWETPSGMVVRVAGPDGRALRNGFNAMVPFVKELMTGCETRAANYGFIRTLSGRRCRFPLNKFKSRPGAPVYADVYKALNRVIQGGSGDQLKTAIVDADEAGFYIQIPPHDELCASVSDRPEGERLAEVMVNAVQLLVPTVVETEIGPNWGDAK